MKYIVYLTTNLKSQINGTNRIYIGVHKTQNPEIFDGYIGCGVNINVPASYKYPKCPFQYAVKKYGISSFKRETLYIFDTSKEAYAKEAEIVDINFIKQDHVYNAALGGGYGYLGRSLYQFDLNGILVKKWEFGIEAYEFYNLPREKFNYAVYHKHPLVDSLWAITETINPNEYTTQAWGEPKVTHLYSKNGKWLKEFISRKDCAEYIGTTEGRVVASIKRNSLLLNKYYVSDKMMDIYIPKARKQLVDTKFYVYKNYKYIGEYIGKDLLKLLNDFSWTKIRDRLRNQNHWIKDFYISESFIDENKIPAKKKKNGISVDIYTKYGDFIETLESVKEVREKYHINSSKIKNIQLGDKYIGDYIFKYRK